MSEANPLPIKDFLLLTILSHAGCKTNIRSFKELENDPKALEVYRSKKTIRRLIFRFWHRDPKGEYITQDNSCFGKMTPNKIQFWGATLLDFYFTHRIPSVPHLMTVSTGSKLLRWMIKKGETNHAVDEMISSAKEEDPREILPFPISEVIESQEMNIRLGIYGESKLIDKREKSNHDKDIFSPGSYPAPWPLLPFSYEAAPLEHRIPWYQLPPTLVVHDPWDLLSVSGFSSLSSYRNRYDWASTEDHTYMYKLALSKKGKERIDKEAETAKADKIRRRLKFFENLGIDDPETLSCGLEPMLLVPSSVKPGPSEPPVLVLYEPAPDPKDAETAHLYLSPAEIIGKGNHSLVINAEWEIPRSLVVPDILCYECILEDVHQTLLIVDGPDGSMKAEKWKRKSGTWQQYQVGHSPEVLPGAFEKLQLKPGSRSPIEHVAYYLVRPGNLETKYKYVGPVRAMKADVKWQNGENYCSHVSKRLGVDKGTRAHPLTAKVSVVAKLSKEGDYHLGRESDVYEEFPQHFFEHWNGYNIHVPLQNPTPVGAVVPQYYGYYQPPEDDSREGYLSPIMLLEKCGQQVKIDELGMDDRIECASLFFRLHNEGYIHESVYPRNVLHQVGPIDRPMYQRGTGDFTEDGRTHGFRLIDFGRTCKYQSPTSRSYEEMTVGEMTKHTWYDDYLAKTAT